MNNRRPPLRPQHSFKKQKPMLPTLDTAPPLDPQRDALHVPMKNDRGRKDIIETNKTQYAWNLLEKGFEESGNAGIFSLNHIDSDAVLNAPEDFFDKYSDTVYRITDYIQERLSLGDKATTISKVRANPIKKDIKEQALYAIQSEFVRYETEARDIKYLSLNANEKRLVTALVANEIIGLGPLEPLFQDHKIREIICNGPYDVQVEIDGAIQKVPSLKFRDKEHLQDLITRLYGSVNKDISRTNPMERARLFDNSRVFAVHDSVAPLGPTLNIRRHTDDWVSPDRLIGFGSANEELFTWLGNHVYNGLSMVVAGGTGSGKALSYDTIIPTPSGIMTMGELEVGDIIFDKNGYPTKITKIFEQGEKPIWEVEFENGEIIQADTDHRWLITDDTSLDYRVQTTEQIYNRLLDKHPAVPNLSRHVKYTYIMENLPIHPYLLGLYYGMGEDVSLVADNATLKEIIDILEELDTNFRITEPINGRSEIDPAEFFGRTLNDLEIKLDEELPEVYEISSTQVRGLFVKGLVDGMGEVKDGIYRLKNLPEKLFYSVFRVLASLGLAPKMDPKTCSIEFTTHFETPFCYLKEKAKEHKRFNPCTTEDTKIVDIRKTDKTAPMRCLTVDSLTHTFLCGHGHIVTHNTTLLSALTAYFPNNKRIVTVERNIEMKGCSSKLFSAAMEVVPPKAGATNTKGVTMEDLVEATTQMRPDIIILGEITGPESYQMLTAANSGHQVFTTVHANDAASTVYRLVTLTSMTGLITGKAVFDLIAEAVDLVVIVTRFPQDGSRKITMVAEMGTHTERAPNGELYLPVTPIWEFIPDEDSRMTDKVTGHWKQVNNLSEERTQKHRLAMAPYLSFEELSNLY